MCVHFHSWNRCSSCFLTFNRRRNRVPCWNGSLSRWRVHRHGLSCRSGWYERADDEVYTHLSCEACALEAASLGPHNNHVDNTNYRHHDDDDDGKGGVVEARSRRARRLDEGDMGMMADLAVTPDMAVARDRSVAKKRRVGSLHGVLVRLFSLREVLRLRGTRRGRRHFRVRIWML